MINESLDHTVRLIEDIRQVDPTAHIKHDYELDILVQHMRSVIGRLDKEKDVSTNE